MSRIDNLIREADDCLARGATAEAAERLADASRLAPHDPEPPLLAAMAHVRDGNLGRAASMALRSILVRPFHPAAQNLLAVVCADAGYPAEALRLLRRVRHETPGFKQARRNQKQIQRTRGEVEPNPDFPIEDVRAQLDDWPHGLSVCTTLVDGTSVDETVASVRGIADQIVVLDARSDPEPAGDRESGEVRVVHSTPTADRAELVNAALRFARESWVLVLQPGETLEPASHGKLTQAMRHKRALFHDVRVTGPDGASMLSARLFRNAPGIAYAGCILPSVRPALAVLAREWQLTSARSGVTLRQPPSASVEGTEDTRQRDLAAACKELNAQPKHPALMLQFVRLATATGDPENALQAIAILEGSPFAEPEELVISAARCLIRLERWSQARERLEAFHAKQGPTRNTWYLLGVIAGAEGDATTAARALETCSRTPGSDSTVPPLPEIRGAALPNLLGSALLDLGRYEDARGAFEEALEREPLNVEARVGLMSLDLARGEIERLLHQLDDWIADRGDDPRVWFYGSVLLGRIPEFAEVNAQWTREALRRFPDDSRLRQQGIEAEARYAQPGTAEAVDA